MKKKVLEVMNANEYEIYFDNFDDYLEFREVIRILKEELGVEEVKVTGFESMEGYFLKDGKKFELKFNNWDSIVIRYDNPKDEAAINLMKYWKNLIFDKLIAMFPD